MNKLKQSGMSMYLLLYILVTCASILTLAFKFVPVVSENYYIVSALKSLAETHQDDLENLSKTQVRSELKRFYMLNNVRSDGANALEVKKTKEKTVIKVAYEVRVPIVWNVDAVLKFNNVLDSSKPEKCCTLSAFDAAKEDEEEENKN